LQTLKGGGAMAVKYMSFTGTIIGTSLLLQAYRNKSSPFDFTVGGGRRQFCFKPFQKEKF
jgi:hypothetical protein